MIPSVEVILTPSEPEDIEKIESIMAEGIDFEGEKLVPKIEDRAN
jgi:predicted transcriptional regulator